MRNSRKQNHEVESTGMTVALHTQYFRSLGFALAMIVGLAACSGADSAATDSAIGGMESGTATQAETETSAASPGERGAAGVQGTPMGEGGRSSGAIRSPGDTARVTARISEFRIELDHDTIESGGISLLLRNEGDRPHTIELRAADGMRWQSIPIPPGGAVTMSMLLSPGSFKVASITAAYVERGMTASLVVR